jgi:hypothetical protein
VREREKEGDDSGGEWEGNGETEGKMESRKIGGDRKRERENTGLDFPAAIRGWKPNVTSKIRPKTSGGLRAYVVCTQMLIS